MEEVKWTCDCGCGAEAIGIHAQEGWISVEQNPNNKARVARLKRSVHFVSIYHLFQWLEEAVVIGADLETSYQDGPRPCGDLGREDFPTIFV